MIEPRAPCALLGTRLTEDRIETDVLKRAGVLLGRSWNLFLIKSRQGSSRGPSASGGGSALVSRGFRLIRLRASYELRGSSCCSPSAWSWCSPFSQRSTIGLRCGRVSTRRAWLSGRSRTPWPRWFNTEWRAQHQRPTRFASSGERASAVGEMRSGCRLPQNDVDGWFRTAVQSVHGV